MMGSRVFLPRLSGVFGVIKPQGITSADACNLIKDTLHKELDWEQFGSRPLKVGHGGTLDKDACGVMVVGIEAGCHLLKLFLHGDKRYIGTGRLGIETNTYNASGDIVAESPYGHITEEKLKAVIQNYKGDTMQVPPVYSALKYKGRRISDIARSGNTVPEMKPRRVTLNHVTCLKFKLPYFTLDLQCGGGFYVRSFMHDIGKALGSCAHLVELERIQHGVVTKQDALSINQWTLENIVKSIAGTDRKYRHILRHRRKKSSVIKQSKDISL